MGWQKRVEVEVYDSLSGYGFAISCCTGKVVMMSVIKKVQNERGTALVTYQSLLTSATSVILEVANPWR